MAVRTRARCPGARFVAGATDRPGLPVSETRLPPGELASAFTDLLIALEAIALAMMVPEVRGDVASVPRRRRIAAGFRVFFAATAVAAGTGAALHGLFADRTQPVRRALWRISLAAIGIAALSGWRTGAALALPRGQASRIERVAIGAHTAFVAWVLTRDAKFLAAVAAYLPSTAFLAWAFASRLDDDEDRTGGALGLAAIAITLAAAGIQVSRRGIHARFDSNATYHSVQGIGLLALAAAARALVRPTQPRK